MNNVNPDLTLMSGIKEAFEGFKNVAYLDSGKVWTVGTGHTWNYDKNRKVQKHDVISRTTDAIWLGKATEGVIKDLNKYIKKPLTSYQSAAIVDYVYNRGIGNFLSTQLDELINSNPNDPRILEEIMKTGLRDRIGTLLWGLGRRRYSQAYMYKFGVLKTNWSKWIKPKF